MHMKWVVIAASLAVSGAALAEDTAPADIWKARCKGCHGEDGKAKTRVGMKENIPDFTSPDWQKHMSDADIRKIIAEGSPKNAKMKAFQDRLSPTEIDSLVKYVRGFNTEKK